MRHILAVAVFAMALSACGAPEAEDAQEDTRTLEERLESVAGKITKADPSVFGKRFADTMISARVEEGNVLVVRLAGVSTVESFDVFEAQKELRPKICSARNFKRVFAQGGEVHFELISTIGKRYPRVQFSKC